MLPLPSRWTHPALNRPLCPPPGQGRRWEEAGAQSRSWEGCDESQWSLRLHPMYFWGCTLGSVGLELLGCGCLRCRTQPPGGRAKPVRDRSSFVMLDMLLVLKQLKGKGKVSWDVEISATAMFFFTPKRTSNVHLTFGTLCLKYWHPCGTEVKVCYSLFAFG